jgi:hypothetical protein
MGDEQASHFEGLLQSSIPRVAIVVLQRVEEIIPAVRESLVSVVSRLESCHAIIWMYMAKGGKSCKGSLC